MSFFLKASFALKALQTAHLQVEESLQSPDPDRSQILLSLCSRDSHDLEDTEIRMAAISSIGENLSDSFIAPLFYFCLGGLPFALAYRFINTADAMLGYQDERRYRGFGFAKIDDLANLIPARLTAICIGLTALTGRAQSSVQTILKITLRDAKKTASPNSGYPMAALAARLGISLSKRGCYRLGNESEPVTGATMLAAWRVVSCAAGIATLTAGASLLWSDL